jgi:hypothetical protein
LSITPLFNSSKTSWAHVTLIGCSPSPAVSLTIVLIEPFLKSLSQQTYNNEDTSPLSVALFYKGNAERQQFVCEDFNYDDEAKEITSEQEIKIDFRYAPEITPNIVIFEDVKIIVDNDSGLSGFWDNEIFDIPTYARIAYYLKLQFTSGDVSSLLYVCCDKDFKKGSIKTIVSETAGEGEQPIRVTVHSENQSLFLVRK